MNKILLAGTAMLALAHGMVWVHAAPQKLQRPAQPALQPQWAGSGVRVEFVEPNSAAAQAGVQAGDVVTGVGGRPINRWDDLDSIVAASGGHALAIDIVRSGIHLRLRAAPRLTGRANRFGKVRELGLGSYGKLIWGTGSPGTDFIPIPPAPPPIDPPPMPIPQ